MGGADGTTAATNVNGNSSYSMNRTHGIFVVPRWLAATWEFAKTAEGRSLMCGVIGSACRESVLAMMEGVGLRLPSVVPSDEDVADDKDRTGPTIVEMSPLGTCTNAESSQHSPGQSRPVGVTSASGKALLWLDTYRLKSIQASILFLASLLVAVALYYYVNSIMWRPHALSFENIRLLLT